MSTKLVGCYFNDFPKCYIEHDESSTNLDNRYYFSESMERYTLPPITISLAEQKDYPINSTQITFDLSSDSGYIRTDSTDIINSPPENPTTDTFLSGRIIYNLEQLDKLNYQLLMTIIPNSELLIGNETGYHMKLDNVSGVNVDSFPGLDTLLQDVNIGDFESRTFTDTVYIKLYYVLTNDSKQALNPTNSLDFSHTYTFIAKKSGGGGGA